MLCLDGKDALPTWEGCTGCMDWKHCLDRVDALVISGGCVQIPDIAALIESHVGVPTVLADPFGPGSAIKANKLVARHGPSMIKAAGLAVRGAG